MSETLDRIPQLMHELHNQRASNLGYRDQYLTQIERQKKVSSTLLNTVAAFCLRHAFAPYTRDANFVVRLTV